MFVCKRCGKEFQLEGYNKEGTFYTLCGECGRFVLNELAQGITKVEIQDLRGEGKK